jgi:heme exporter protein C
MTKKPVYLTVLDVLSGVLFLAALGLVFLYSPVEITMGLVQKVFYFHVATAWVGMLGFMVSAAAGVMYLWKGKKIWDIAGFSAVEISFVFFLTAIITGSIWARPTWNTWWTWDPRLTTAAIVELIYGAYLLLRQGIDHPERKARFAAVYAIFGFLSVPLTFISIRLLRTIHPVVVGGGDPSVQGGFSMTGPMKMTFFFALFAFSVIFADILWHRIRLGKLQEEISRLRWKID